MGLELVEARPHKFTEWALCACVIFTDVSLNLLRPLTTMRANMSRVAADHYMSLIIPNTLDNGMSQTPIGLCLGYDITSKTMIVESSDPCLRHDM